MTLDLAWLDTVTEDILEPDRPIVDPHHHFWDRSTTPWYRSERYLLHELLNDTGSGHDVRATVYIECRSMWAADGPEAMRPVGETEFVNGLSAMSASGLYGDTRAAAGIVGFADLTLGAGVKPVLEAHIAAGGGRFRGIRHSASWDASDAIRNGQSSPSQHLLLEEDFREGLAQLAPLGLTFEGWFYHPTLPDFIDLALTFPDTTFIVNHCAGPLGIGPYAGHRDAIFAEWQARMSELSECSNVNVKLGGLQMDVNGFSWHERDRPPGSEELAEATAPYYLHCIEEFGAERCMFESNFPVDNLSCSYHVLWNAFKRIAASRSEAEKAALFHDTAARVYRIVA